MESSASTLLLRLIRPHSYCALLPSHSAGQVEMKKGIMAYAGYGKHSRSTQIWIGYDGASGLGQSPWETPFAEIVSGMDSVERIFGKHQGAPSKQQQQQLQASTEQQAVPSLR